MLFCMNGRWFVSYRSYTVSLPESHAETDIVNRAVCTPESWESAAGRLPTVVRYWFDRGEILVKQASCWFGRIRIIRFFKGLSVVVQ